MPRRSAKGSEQGAAGQQSAILAVAGILPRGWLGAALTCRSTVNDASLPHSRRLPFKEQRHKTGGERGCDAGRSCRSAGYLTAAAIAFSFGNDFVPGGTEVFHRHIQLVGRDQARKYVRPMLAAWRDDDNSACPCSRLGWRVPAEFAQTSHHEQPDRKDLRTASGQHRLDRTAGAVIRAHRSERAAPPNQWP